MRYIVDRYVGDSTLDISLFAIGAVIVVVLIGYWVNRTAKPRM